MNKELDSTPVLFEQIKHFNEYKAKINLMKFDVEYIESNWHFIVEYGFENMSETEYELLHRLYNWSKRMDNCCHRIEKRLSSYKTESEINLKTRICLFEKRLHDFEDIVNRFEKKKISSTFECVSDNCQTLNELEIQLNECKVEAKLIESEQQLLECKGKSFRLLFELVERKTDLDMIWKTMESFRQKETEWMSKSMSSLNVNDIRLSIEGLLRASTQMSKTFKTKSIDLIQNVKSLQINIISFKQNYIPLLEVLSNPVLSERHWFQINQLLGQQSPLKSWSTLNEVISLTNATKHLNQIQLLGNIALKEHELEMFLQKMKNQWMDDWPEDALEVAANKFLEGESLDIGLRQKCAKSFKFIHLDCIHFFTTIHPKTRGQSDLTFYVTPPMFIQLILTFKTLLREKQKQITFQRERYYKGIEKLDFAAKQVRDMKNQLFNDFQPLLLNACKETETLMTIIEKESLDIEMEREIIATDEAIANRSAASAQQMRDDCTKELSQAIPAIKSAVNALNTLKSNDISVLKSMKSPPLGVRMTLEAVCILKGYKPERKLNAKTYDTFDDYWSSSLKMLSDVRFLDSLRSFDKDNIDHQSIALVRDRYLRSHYLEPKSLAKVSKACEGLAEWVRAVDIYDRVINVIKPKRQRLRDSETQLLEVLQTLEIKKKQLQKTCDFLQQTNDRFAAMSKKKKQLEDDIDLCRLKLLRAKQLVDGFSAEKIRWKDNLDELSNQSQHLIGDIILCAATVVYTSALNLNDRLFCLNKWQNYLRNECKLSLSPTFSLVNTLGVGHKIRLWIEAGLRDHPFDIENAIICDNCEKYPIIIENNIYAKKWIRGLHPNHISIDFGEQTEDVFKSFLFSAIKVGNVVIIENVQQIESSQVLLELIDKEVNLKDGIQYIRFGNESIEYSNRFKLFMFSTKDPNLLPKTMTKIQLINWSTNEDSVECDNSTYISGLCMSAEKDRQLIEMEDQILEILSKEETSVLDDENGIKLLAKYRDIAKEMTNI